MPFSSVHTVQISLHCIFNRPMANVLLLFSLVVTQQYNDTHYDSPRVQFHCFSFYVHDIANSQFVRRQWAERIQRPMLNAPHSHGVRIRKLNFIGKAVQRICRESGSLLRHDNEWNQAAAPRFVLKGTTGIQRRLMCRNNDVTCRQPVASCWTVMESQSIANFFCISICFLPLYFFFLHILYLFISSTSYFHISFLSRSFSRSPFFFCFRLFCSYI